MNNFLKKTKSGNGTLWSIDRNGRGDVVGRPLLHLQCHLVLDIVSWVRQGTGATEIALSLSCELRPLAKLGCSDSFVLSGHLDEEVYIVFIWCGVYGWVPDPGPWSSGIAYFIKVGGVSQIVDTHPNANIFHDECTGISMGKQYFCTQESTRCESYLSYADPDAKPTTDGRCIWICSLYNVLNLLISAELSTQFQHEVSFGMRWNVPSMEQGTGGWWGWPNQSVSLPVLFSLKAWKPDGDLE